MCFSANNLKVQTVCRATDEDKVVNIMQCVNVLLVMWKVDPCNSPVVSKMCTVP